MNRQLNVFMIFSESTELHLRDNTCTAVDYQRLELPINKILPIKVWRACLLRHACLVGLQS